MKLKKIILLTAMVALPSVGLSEEDKVTAYSGYHFDSQPGLVTCYLPKLPEQIDKEFTYFNYNNEPNVSHSSLIKILQKHDNIDITNCFKDTAWDLEYLNKIQTECDIGTERELEFSALYEIINNDNKLEVSCGKTILPNPEENSEHCLVSSKTPYKVNKNLQEMFTRDKCYDIKILNPKNEETGS